MSIKIPLNIDSLHGRLERCHTERESIDMFIELILSTAPGTCVVDKDFGFNINAYRFEIINEYDGVINYNTTREYESQREVDNYNKKISGSSKNINTFAIDCRNVIEKYEKRLKDVNVAMNYIREHRTIYVDIIGTIVNTNTEYSYKTTIKVWS